MEDCIETYRFSLFDKLSGAKCNTKCNTKYIYIYNPVDSNIIIIHDKNTAIQYSKNNNVKIEIFEKEEKGFYMPINEFYINGMHSIEMLR
jgi:hypothetical protein